MEPSATPLPFATWSVLLFASTATIIKGIDTILRAGGVRALEVCPYSTSEEYAANSPGAAWVSERCSGTETLAAKYTHILVQAAQDESQSTLTAAPLAAVYVPKPFREHPQLCSLELLYSVLSVHRSAPKAGDAADEVMRRAASVLEGPFASRSVSMAGDSTSTVAVSTFSAVGIRFVPD